LAGTEAGSLRFKRIVKYWNRITFILLNFQFEHDNAFGDMSQGTSHYHLGFGPLGHVEYQIPSGSDLLSVTCHITGRL
jgi:hypothetical protein